MKGYRGSRRALCALLVLVSLLATAAPALAVGQSTTLANYGDKYIVIAYRLNVRSWAGMSNNVIRSIPKGTKVTFLYEQNGWWRVRYGKNRTGFVDKQYLTRKNVPKKGKYKTTAKVLNVRAEPRITSSQIGYLKKGAKIKVLRVNGDWAYIDYKGHRGWVASRYLKKR